MALRYYANAAATTLASACSSSATSIAVSSTAGLPITYPFILILDRGTSSEEVVLCTAAAGTTLTVTRGYDSTTAFAHALNASVVQGLSAIDAREANVHVNATGGVHGLEGDVVGTTDTQTLSNKTLTAPAATGSLADFGGAWTSYTPTFGGFTVGASTATGRYTQIGKTVHLYAKITLGAGFTIDGTPTLTIPGGLTQAAFPGDVHARFNDVSASLPYEGIATLISGTFTIWATGSIGNATVPGSGAPLLWAVGDTIEVFATLEVV